MSEWQPIETAPGKSGEMLLYYPPVVDKKGVKTHGDRITVGRNNAPRKATHWMPLPEPPE